MAAATSSTVTSVVTQTKEGDTVEVFSDGRKVFKMKAGTTIEQDAKGRVVRQVNADGSQIEVNVDLGVEGNEVMWLERHTLVGGTVVEVYKNDITVQTEPDGSRITKHPGGVTHFDAKTGDTRHRFVDGYELHELADGTRIDVEPGGTMRQVNPDETEIQTLPDGSKVVDPPAWLFLVTPLEREI